MDRGVPNPVAGRLDLANLPRSYDARKSCKSFQDVCLRRLDPNHDGEVTGAELPDVLKAAQAYDDGDGVLSRDEVLAVSSQKAKETADLKKVWQEKAAQHLPACNKYDDCRDWAAAAWTASQYEGLEATYIKMFKAVSATKPVVIQDQTQAQKGGS